MQTPKRVVALSLILLALTVVSPGKTARADSLTTSSLAMAARYPWLSGTKYVPPFSPVAFDDPDKPIVDAEVSSLVSGYEESHHALADATEPARLQTDALTRLFPGYGFYMIGWSEAPPPSGGRRRGGYFSGLFYCLAIVPNGEKTRLENGGDQGRYAKFLWDNGVSIKSEEDARQVWLALCDIFQISQHSPKVIHISPTEWHLGVYTNAYGQHGYYCVMLNAGKKVVSVQEVMETSTKRD